ATIRKAAVRSSEVKNGSLQVRDLSREARRRLRGARGPQGPQGPPGPAGPAGTGQAGRPGGPTAIGLTIKNTVASAPAAPNEEASGISPRVSATCDPGQRATGGGVSVGDRASMAVVESYPEANGTAWTATVNNDAGAARAFTVYAVCTTG
ncbi:MAG: hypothetical protein M3P39_06240, partial [Actinomycetota bacterium]|nr:hypothetical protein [Actinomycetota bacterium]